MKTPAKCGTRSGYNRHLRHSTQVCEDCRNAQNEYDRKRYEQNKKYFKDKNARNFNREAKIIRWHRRQATIKNNGFSKYTFEDIVEKYGTACYICKLEIDFNAPRQSNKKDWELGLHIDHFIPVSRGGPDTIENVRPSHAICNLRKSNSLPVYR